MCNTQDRDSLQQFMPGRPMNREPCHKQRQEKQGCRKAAAGAHNILRLPTCTGVCTSALVCSQGVLLCSRATSCPKGCFPECICEFSIASKLAVSILANVGSMALQPLGMRWWVSACIYCPSNGPKASGMRLVVAACTTSNLGIAGGRGHTRKACRSWRTPGLEPL